MNASVKRRELLGDSSGLAMLFGQWYGRMLLSSRLWILPLNDAEMMEIRQLLLAHDEAVAVSSQPWGATWSNLETGLVNWVEEAVAANPNLEIRGVELAGPSRFGGSDIDHHQYRGDDRSHPLSSLEQIAGLLGTPLTRWQQLVAANDRGYIPAMRALGATPSEIMAVRRYDRTAQGVTERDEERAERDIAEASYFPDLVEVYCPDGSTSAHSDRLYEVAAQILLIDPNKWTYFGPRHSQLAGLELPEHNWTGGSPASGYWGIKKPSLASQIKIRRALGGPFPASPDQSTGPR